MSTVPGPHDAIPAPPRHHEGGNNDNDNECDHCHKLLRATVPPRKDLEAWTKAKMCDCAPFDEFACTCSCGHAPTTHVVDVASKRLVAWCGRRQCKRVAAMSYRWPQEWKATPPSIEVQACAGCGQQPSDGPFARKDEEFAAMSSEYGFLWVDHWCTRGCADIPRLRSVYQQSDKVVLPMDGERPVSVVALVALFVAWCFVFPLGLVGLAFRSLTNALGRGYSALAPHPCPQRAFFLVVYIPVYLCALLFALVLLVVLSPASIVGKWLAGQAQGTAPRSKRLWLRVESAYTRTHAVLLPSGLTHSLRWRVSIEVLAREWGTWFWDPDPDGSADELSECDVYSVSDLFLVELMGGLDVSDFVDKAVEAGKETLHGRARDHSLPRWLPSRLGELYKPDTLMGCTIEAKHAPGAVEATVNGKPFLLVRVPGDFAGFLQLRRDPEEEEEVFVVVGSGKAASYDEEVPVTCRRLSAIKL